MTSDGEFVHVKIKNSIPHIGDEYCGEVYKKPLFLRPAAAAACFAFLFFGANTAYAYYTPVSSIYFETNSSVRLDTNKWDKVIKAVPLDKNAEKLLKYTSVKNHPINEALTIIAQEAKKENYIDADRKNNIKVSVKYNKNAKKIDFSSFHEYADKNNIKVILNNGAGNSAESSQLKNSTSKPQSSSKKDKNINKTNKADSNSSESQNSNNKTQKNNKADSNSSESQNNNKANSNSSESQNNNNKKEDATSKRNNNSSKLHGNSKKEHSSVKNNNTLPKIQNKKRKRQ